MADSAKHGIDGVGDFWHSDRVVTQSDAMRANTWAVAELPETDPPKRKDTRKRNRRKRVEENSIGGEI